MTLKRKKKLTSLLPVPKKKAKCLRYEKKPYTVYTYEEIHFPEHGSPDENFWGGEAGKGSGSSSTTMAVYYSYLFLDKMLDNAS